MTTIDLPELHDVLGGTQEMVNLTGDWSAPVWGWRDVPSAKPAIAPKHMSAPVHAAPVARSGTWSLWKHLLHKW